MKKNFVLLLIAAGIFSACRNNRPKNETPPQNAGKNFFPVTDFIRSEINYVDSLPLGILKYYTRNNRTDTSYIHAAAFNELADDFVCGDLRPAIFENEFSESSFIDQSTQATTFTYSTKNNKLELQRVDVLATTGEVSNKVSSIYLEKSIRKNDTVITKKLLWKTRKSFQIVTIRQILDKKPEIEELRVVWDPE